MAEHERQFCRVEGNGAMVEGKHLEKTHLMRRRGLRRHPEVKIKIDNFWNALNALNVEGKYIPKAVYLTYHMKIARALHSGMRGAEEEPTEEDTVEMLKAEKKRQREAEED